MSNLAKKLNFPKWKIVEDLEPKPTIDLVVTDNYSSIIQNNQPEFAAELRLAQNGHNQLEQMFANPCEFILGDKLKDKMSFLFYERNDKDLMIQEIKGWCFKTPKAKRLEDTIHQITDELFTNVLFNAPTAAAPDSKNRKFPHILPQSKPGLLFLGVTDERLLLGAIDQYGSLNVQKLLKQLHGTFQQGIAGAMNHGPGGAGIGCRMIFDRGLSFYVAVQAGIQSLVATTLPIGPNARAVNLDFKNVHFFRG